MRWAIVIVAVVVLLGSVSLAAADDAWVLWIKRSPRESDGYWDLWARYPSLAACEEARRTVIHDGVVKDMLIREQFMTDGELQRETETRLTSDARHRCLPDTVDPRESK